MLEDLDVEVVGEAENGLDALGKVKDRRPDVLLLDISMPEIDGLDVARHLDEPQPLIVFQTAYDEYALEAFEHEAVDYLVKPVARKALERAIERSRKRLEERAQRRLTSELLGKLRASVAQVASTRSPRLLVRERAGHRLVPYDEIVCFRADGGVVFAETDAADTGGAEFLTDYTLKELEERTFGTFVRANRAELINLDRIVRIAGNSDGSATLTLRDGREVRVARRRAAALRRALEG